MKFLILNGPNINILGIREPDIYGRQTYDDLVKLIKRHAEELGVEVEFVQSNHEGDLVDAIQNAYFSHTDASSSTRRLHPHERRHCGRGQGCRHPDSRSAYLRRVEARELPSGQLYFRGGGQNHCGSGA